MRGKRGTKERAPKDCVTVGIYQKEETKSLIMGNQKDYHYAHYEGLTVGLCMMSYNLMAIIEH